MWLSIFVCAVIYAYFKWRFNYWTRRNVKSLAVSIPFGNVGNPITRKCAFYESVANVYNAFKATSNYAGFYSLTRPYLVPIDNELVKRILIADFSSFVNRGLYYNEETDPLSANLFFIGGNKWRALRKKLSATFTSGKMSSMFNIVVECSQRMVDKLENYDQDVRELLARYSTEVIGSCAFGLDCGSLDNSDSEFRTYTKKLFEYTPGKTLKRLAQILWPDVCRILGTTFIPKDVSDFFIKAVEETVAMRKERNIKRNDFLDLLLELESEGMLNKKDFAAQSFVFFIAGFETSSTTLGYLLYELSKNIEVQRKCREEILKTLPNGVMSYEKIMGMKYLDQVVEETLRLYPVLPFLNRECTETFKVDSNLTLQKGSHVIIPTLAIHMNEEYFQNPNVFDPNRFTPENRTSIKSCTYMPFGEGPRKCIGDRFGLMQVKVGIVAILSKYNVVKNSITSDRLKWDTNGFTLKTKDNIYLDFVKV